MLPQDDSPAEGGIGLAVAATVPPMSGCHARQCGDRRGPHSLAAASDRRSRLSSATMSISPAMAGADTNSGDELRDEVLVSWREAIEPRMRLQLCKLIEKGADEVLLPACQLGGLIGGLRSDCIADVPGFADRTLQVRAGVAAAERDKLNGRFGEECSKPFKF